MNKNEIKNFIQETIEVKIKKYNTPFYQKFWRRVNTITRTQINRLSYELKYDNAKIYLIKDGRERIIETKSRNENLSKQAFKESENLLKEIKTNEFFATVE